MSKMKSLLKQNMYVQLFAEFFTLGLFTVGGGMAMVAILEDRVCTKRHWMTQEETLDCIVVSQTLPGVIALNMSIYVGYRMKGIKGAIAAVTGMVLPSLVIIILIATVLDRIYENTYVQGAMMAIRAAATGLICHVAVKMGKQTFTKGKLSGADIAFYAVMMAASFVAIGILGISALWVILCSIAIGICYFMLIGSRIKEDESR